MGILQVTLSLIWVGIVIGTSFIAAPLRFRAPGIDLKLGVGITKLITGVVSKLELLFCAILLVSFIFIPPSKLALLVYVVIVLVLAVQFFKLIPTLNRRARLIMRGEQPPKTKTHTYVIVSEILKIVLLLFFVFVVFKEGMF